MPFTENSGVLIIFEKSKIVRLCPALSGWALSNPSCMEENEVMGSMSETPSADTRRHVGEHNLKDRRDEFQNVVTGAAAYGGRGEEVAVGIANDHQLWIGNWTRMAFTVEAEIERDWTTIEVGRINRRLGAISESGRDRWRSSWQREGGRRSSPFLGVAVRHS